MVVTSKKGQIYSITKFLIKYTGETNPIIPKHDRFGLTKRSVFDPLLVRCCMGKASKNENLRCLQNFVPGRFHWQKRHGDESPRIR